MSLEKCKLCNQDSTPWVHINGHICQDCYANTKRLWSSEKISWISVKDKEIPDYEVLLYSEEEGFQVGNNQFDMNVTHWMPLPEKPE